MQISTLLITITLLTLAGYFFGRRRAASMARGVGDARRLHSLPKYYGYLTGVLCGLPALAVVLLWSISEDKIVTHLVVGELPADIASLTAGELDLYVNDVKNLVQGNVVSGEIDSVIKAAATHYSGLLALSSTALSIFALALTIGGGVVGLRLISPTLPARNWVEAIIKAFLVVCSVIAIFTTVGIVLSVLFEAIRFFDTIPIFGFLFGLEWSPQMAIREDQVGSSGAFGAVPLIAGTALISLIAMLVAVPIGLMSAIYLSEYADTRVRAAAKPALEILAGVPTVVYGFFAALTVAPLIRDV
ncbi:MAG: phosphate ABC transporter permease family protein, partial [Gammaproteobacteria bacterium]|nr:phosphate ABC transporter permease family protein [Gammaproteobacteria bacterium]